MTLHEAKRDLLANGWWIAALGAVLFLPVWLLSTNADWRILLTVLGGLLSGAFILQRQYLDELRLFHDLFKEFNARYDRISARLQEIAAAGVVQPADSNLIANYFNLCAEEYWWYRAGYVPENVWRAWCRGMMFYLDRSPFAREWEQEVSTGSYYGLTLDTIRQGAR